MTKYAEEILNIVNHSTEHLTAEQIFLRMKKKYDKVVLATIYNNLNALVFNGAVRKITMLNGADLYDKMERHDHLVCSRCGHLSDLFLDDMTDLLEKQSGIRPDFYDLKLFYICDKCRKNEKGEDEWTKKRCIS